ncbi:MAG: hypothetical protein NTW49_05100 [Bacteroidia bacterium]|nr:hypothetical protein [Bacteroidia bacterium]
MSIINKTYSVFSGLLILFYAQPCHSGPSFNTDDPQPVQLNHWEYYLSSINTFKPGIWSGTCPHFEVNYGLISDVQVHLLLPLNYYYIPHHNIDFGYADTEFGVKYRFVQETNNSPQIGTFPILEIPTIKNDEFSDRSVQIFIPIWIQKSWNKFTTYGGIGYLINPGSNNKNSVFSGWEIQYDFSEFVTLGGELYYHSADSQDSKSVTAFNIGGSINASSITHFIFSAGHNLTNERFISAYVGLLFTI